MHVNNALSIGHSPLKEGRRKIIAGNQVSSPSVSIPVLAFFLSGGPLSGAPKDTRLTWLYRQQLRMGRLYIPITPAPQQEPESSQ
jgi:hypothetical protein